MSLRPLLRAIVLDETRPEWQRGRSVEAYLNGADDPASTRRELFGALSGEAISAGREALRARLLARLPASILTVADVQSVLADYQQIPADNTVGRLSALLRRLENEPLPALFDVPISSWFAPRSGQRDSFEVEHVLDYTLAAAIKGTSDLTSARLWRWTVNIRDHAWSNLKDEAGKALATWLDEDKTREVSFFDTILTEDDPATGPWVVPQNYMRATRRHPSAAVISDVLAKAARTLIKADKKRLLAIAVEMARHPKTDIDTYWKTYDYIAREPGCKALRRHLTTEKIEKWRLDDFARAAKVRRREAKEKIENVRTLGPLLAEMRVGGQPGSLNWASVAYFEGENRRGRHGAGIQRVIDLTDEVTTAAILEGWNYLATKGLGDIDAAQLGQAEAKGSRYYVETAAMAGLDLLISEDRLPALSTIPIEVAITVLKSSFIISDEERRTRLERWALDRLNLHPTEGGAQLLAFWGATLDEGATQLSGLWRLLDEDARGGAVAQALESLLGTHPAMSAETLRAALRAGAKHLDHTRLLALAKNAIEDASVIGAQRVAWTFIAFALDPRGHTDRLAVEHSGDDIAALFDDDGLVEIFGTVAGADRLHLDTTAIRLLGGTTTPEAPRSGWVTRSQHLSDVVSRAIQALSSDPRPEDGEALSGFVDDSNLAAWRPSLRHAQAQQMRLRRDHDFKHATASAVRLAIAGGTPINARDLRAVVMEELRRLRAELHTTDTTPWKRYWNVDSNGKVSQPLIENECRDHLLDRVRDRLKKYAIAAAVPEARRGEETRADILVLTGAGRNLPIEAKRHFHGDIWIAASTQLQGYATDPDADGFGVYLVFWFGNEVDPTPSRPDGGARPTSAAELEAMLVSDLSPEIRTRTDVIVFDVSDPRAAGAGKPRRRRGTHQR